MTITQQQAVKICPVNDAACGELPPSVRCAECKQSTAQPQAVVPAPTYVDSTPHLHVGESSFEGWYQAHPKACTGDKQLARDAYAAGMGDPLVTAAQPSAQAERAPVQAVQATSERTPQDYAIEHAEYMAVDGERLIAAINDFGKALQEVDDGTANPSDVDAARETLTEALGALRSGIYEFRKRRDRASSGATPADVRMLTEDEQAAIIDMHNTGRAQGDHECVEDIQRKFAKVNGLRIPADGKIGGAA